jgi:glycosyltransferase involved in cell wall biosynthesis
VRRLVVVTQEVDPEHPVLGHTVAKLKALAGRVDELVVLAGGAAPGAFATNVRIRLFAAGSRAGRGARFGAALARELRPRPVAVLAHMCPIYAVLAAPLARPLGVPVLLWYTHPTASRTLRAAERVSTRVLSVDKRSFPFASRKLTAIGHGIDVARFSCRDGGGNGLRLLALGRYSSVKGYPTLLRALSILPGAELDVHGPVSNAAEEAHRRELEEMVAELGLGGRVRLGDAVPASEVPLVLARADALISTTLAGSADKAVLEAAASCVPVLSTGGVFDSLLPPELRFGPGDVEGLADRLAAFARLDAAERSRLGAGLRAAVERDHSVETWAERVLSAAS